MSYFDEEQDDPAAMPQKRSALNAYGSAALRGMAGHKPQRTPYGQMGAGIGGAIGGMMRMRHNRQMDPGAIDAGQVQGAPQNPQAGPINSVVGQYGSGAQPVAPPPIMPKPAFGDEQDQQDPGELPMAHGAIVMKPTRVLVGEKTPEAIVPLNNNPKNKVSTSLLRRC